MNQLILTRHKININHKQQTIGERPAETLINKKQELQEVLQFPIEIFWNLEASLKSELSYF